MAKTANRWWISDLHLGHEKCVTTFKRDDGSPMRDFASVEAMDAAIIDNWNAVVADHDRVYVLGDCVIARRNLPKLALLKGKKTLVMGNHDIFGVHEYLKYFERIEGCLVFDNFAATHVPVHPAQLARFAKNVHGHLHHRVVMDGDAPDARYINVSVEQVGYAPLSHDELKRRG